LVGIVGMKLDRNEVIAVLGSARNGAFYNDDACDDVVLNKIANDYFGSKAKAVLAELFKRRWVASAYPHAAAMSSSVSPARIRAKRS
jgi:hypothetical protein